jgi:hypothetical protein
MIGSWYETTVKRTVVKTTPERNRNPTGKSIVVERTMCASVIRVDLKVAVLFPLSRTSQHPFHYQMKTYMQAAGSACYLQRFKNWSSPVLEPDHRTQRCWT